MKQKYAFLLGLGFLLCNPALVLGQCTSAVVAMASTTLVANAAWAPATVPGNMSATLNTTIASVGTTTATMTSTNGLTVGTPVSGPNVPAGTTIAAVVNATTITLSQPSSGSGTNIPHTYTLPAYANNFPPTTSGTPLTSHCSVCPSLFSVPVCANNYAQMYMCIGNVYTITLCNSATPWNSTLTITNATGATSYGYDDDGCGPVNGLSTITFSPTINQLYRFRVFTDPCVVDAASCGTLEISCAPSPPPPSNDNAWNAATSSCSAISLPVSTACSMTFGTTAWATQSAGVPSCGAFAGVDVWFSAVVPASGNLSVQTALGSATNIAMAVYTAPSCSGAMTQIPGACNADASPGVLAPFITLSGLTGGSTVYIRVWPESGAANTGTFQVCAYEPVPPVNDNPCGAIALAVPVVCTPNAFTTESATPLSASITAAVPSCGTPIAGGDVWFTVVIPASGSVVVNTLPGSLTDMAMAAYQLTSGTICGTATLTQAIPLANTCNDTAPGGSTMPRITVSGTPGATYYIRVWNKTAAFGTFSICAYQNNPPANDNPCAATPLTVRYGCIFSSYTNENATITLPSGAGWTSAPNPAAPCATASPFADVWFTAVVPAGGNGVLQFDTDEGLLTNGAMVVYTATGTCGGGNLSLTQVACATGGSGNGATMPYVSATGLTPGSTVYVRVWRDGGVDGTFQLCARRTDSPTGTCDYVMTMADAGGDGWNGSTVTICVDPAGAPPMVCTPYTVIGSVGSITVSANVGDQILVSYTASGGFQNEISYQLRTPSGGLLYSSTTPPTAGANTAFVVNSACNVPPAPTSDCAGAFEICTNGVYGGNPTNTGNTADLNASNRGCLSSNERQGEWYRINIVNSGTFAFNVTPPSNQDYDFGVWGPYTGTIVCPPAGPPVRCSYSAVQTGTGLNFTEVDLTEGAGGNSFVRYIDGIAGQSYMLYVDNFTMGGVSFTMTFPPAMTADINCVVLPVQLLDLEARPGQSKVDLLWSTGSEMNSSHFIVERSKDNREFQPIGTVQAMGYSTGTVNYLFTDEAPLDGMNYYRLKQVDMDGVADLSKTVTALFRSMDGTPVLVPNPMTDKAQVLLPSVPDGPILLRITDMGGRVVQERQVTLNEGSQQFELSMSGFDSGAYFLIITEQNGGSLGHTRFVKY